MVHERSCQQPMYSSDSHAGLRHLRSELSSGLKQKPGRGVTSWGVQGGLHHKHARVREAAIHISNHSVRDQDQGVIVVGGSIEMSDLTGQPLSCCSVPLFPANETALCHYTALSFAFWALPLGHCLLGFACWGLPVGLCLLT